MRFLKKLFGLGEQKPVSHPAPAEVPQVEVDPSAAAREAGALALDRHWESIGTIERDVIGHVISPQFLGGPAWPSTRQAYRVVHRPDSVILATEGLSDPFDDVEGMGNGFGLELFLETAHLPDALQTRQAEVTAYARSWAFDILRTVATTVANAGGIAAQLERYGVLSLELPGASESAHLIAQLPPAYVTDDDAVGVLVGAPLPDFATDVRDMPLSPVSLVPVVLITAAELEGVRAGGRQAREALAEKLSANVNGHRSALDRV